MAVAELSHLVNPLATASQLELSASQLDGVLKDLEDSIRFETACLLQAATILLRLPQDVVVHSIVIFHRFLVGPDGGSLLELDVKDIAGAVLYLAVKPSARSVTVRQTLTVMKYLNASGVKQVDGNLHESETISDWRLSEGEYEMARDRLYAIEAQVLRVLGFQTHVAVPHTLCINYLQALETFQRADGNSLAKRALAHLNSALLSPQLLYLTHQPSALATAAIYLAARELEIKLPEVEWWEVFDVDREELGFLVVALRSLEGFVREERGKWLRRKVPLTAESLRAEMEWRRMLEAGE